MSISKRHGEFLSGRCAECKAAFVEAKDRFNQTFISPVGWMHTRPCVANRNKRLEERERKAKERANAPYVSRFVPFETMNLSPHGEKVRITSLPQLRREEARFGAQSDPYNNDR